MYTLEEKKYYVEEILKRIFILNKEEFDKNFSMEKDVINYLIYNASDEFVEKNKFLFQMIVNYIQNNKEPSKSDFSMILPLKQFLQIVKIEMNKDLTYKIEVKEQISEEDKFKEINEKGEVFEGNPVKEEKKSKLEQLIDLKESKKIVSSKLTNLLEKVKEVPVDNKLENKLNELDNSNVEEKKSKLDTFKDNIKSGTDLFSKIINKTSPKEDVIENKLNNIENQNELKNEVEETSTSNNIVESKLSPTTIMDKIIKSESKDFDLIDDIPDYYGDLHNDNEKIDNNLNVSNIEETNNEETNNEENITKEKDDDYEPYLKNSYSLDDNNKIDNNEEIEEFDTNQFKEYEEPGVYSEMDYLNYDFGEEEQINFDSINDYNDDIYQNNEFISSNEEINNNNENDYNESEEEKEEEVVDSFVFNDDNSEEIIQNQIDQEIINNEIEENVDTTISFSFNEEIINNEEKVVEQKQEEIQEEIQEEKNENVIIEEKDNEEVQSFSFNVDNEISEETNIVIEEVKQEKIINENLNISNDNKVEEITNFSFNLNTNDNEIEENYEFEIKNDEKIIEDEIKFELKENKEDDLLLNFDNVLSKDKSNEEEFNFKFDNEILKQEKDNNDILNFVFDVKDDKVDDIILEDKDDTKLDFVFKEEEVNVDFKFEDKKKEVVDSLNFSFNVDNEVSKEEDIVIEEVIETKVENKVEETTSFSFNLDQEIKEEKSLDNNNLENLLKRIEELEIKVLLIEKLEKRINELENLNKKMN